MARRERFQTKLEIIKLASELFLTQGYTKTTASQIAEELDISPGNLVYHFPAKEYLLAELTERLCEYHQIVMETEIDEGRTSLLAYLLELASVIALCDENEVARDLYTSIYTNSIPLKLIRQANTEKTKQVFAEYCSEWTQEEFALTENIVSGIEYASLMKENGEDIPIEKRITKTLRMVMKTYNVPEDLRELKIKKALGLDYRRIGRKFIEGFIDYVETINERALDEAHGRM